MRVSAASTVLLDAVNELKIAVPIGKETEQVDQLISYLMTRNGSSGAGFSLGGTVITTGIFWRTTATVVGLLASALASSL